MLNTAESIRTGVPQSKLDFSEGREEELERFLRGLQGGAVISGHLLAELWDFSSCRTLADVGGGSGGLAIAVTETCPHINATVIDLHAVTPITQRIIDEAGASDKVKVSSADVVNEPLPGSYDVAVLRNLIQVLSPDDAVKALRNVFNAIIPGGAIHIIGFTLDNSRLSPISSVGFSLTTLNIYDEGQPYTEQEHRDWLSEAGFEGFELTPFNEVTNRITAQKPAH